MNVKRRKHPDIAEGQESGCFCFSEPGIKLELKSGLGIKKAGTKFRLCLVGVA